MIGEAAYEITTRIVKMMVLADLGLKFITRHRSPSRRRRFSFQVDGDFGPLRASARRFDPAIETIFEPAGGSLPKMSGSEDLKRRSRNV